MTTVIEAPLPEFFEFIRNGMSVKQNKDGAGLPITRIETIANGTIDENRFGYAGLQKEEALKWLLKHGDILFSHINSVEHIGKCALFNGEFDLVHGMNLLCFRPKLDRADPSYFKWLFRSTGFRAQIMPFVNKAVNQASLSIGNLSGLRVTVPSLDEQKRIAEILDQADELRRKRQRAIDRLNQLGQAIFHEMFGDEQKVQRASLKALGKVSTGSTPPTSDEGSFGGAIPFVTPGDLGSGGPAKRSLSEDGARKSRTVGAHATFVCCIGATIGKMDQAQEHSAFNQQINAVEWGPLIEPTYGFYAVQQIRPIIIHKGKGASTTLPILKKSEFEKLEIPCPALALQIEFAQRITAAREGSSALMQSLGHFNALFDSLQHRAFQGEL